MEKSAPYVMLELMNMGSARVGLVAIESSRINNNTHCST